MRFRRHGRTCIAALTLVASLGVAAIPRPVVSAESRIDFVVKEMGVPVKGTFAHFESTVDIDPVDPARSSAFLKIDVSSLTTASEEADAVAMDKDWLDMGHARYATFRSSSFRALGGGRFEADGQLSLRNRSRALVLQFTSVDQPSGRTLITSDFVIHRSDFGIGGGEWNAPGVVAEDIPVNVRLVLGAPGSASR